eukprot:10334041-Heterocapsa_arctica.AAC.1
MDKVAPTMVGAGKLMPPYEMLPGVPNSLVHAIAAAAVRASRQGSNRCSVDGGSQVWCAGRSAAALQGPSEAGAGDRHGRALTEFFDDS